MLKIVRKSKYDALCEDRLYKRDKILELRADLESAERELADLRESERELLRRLEQSEARNERLHTRLKGECDNNSARLDRMSYWHAKEINRLEGKLETLKATRDAYFEAMRGAYNILVEAAAYDEPTDA